MRPIFKINLIVVLFFITTCWGQIPQTISYQSLLTEKNGDAVADGTYSFTFKLYNDADEGSPLWTETQSLSVVNGLMNVILGSEEHLNLAFDVPYWLGISIGEDQELAPRIELTASPYSLIAGSIADTTVSSAKIKDKAIVGTKIANGQIVRSLNTLTDSVRIVGGENIIISVDGDSLVISTIVGASGSGHSLGAADGDPADAVVVDNDGNVGIGKSDPSEALDVVGNIHSSGTISSGNSITINGTPIEGEGPDQITASTGQLAILGEPTIEDIKVGIGTTDIQNKLDVFTEQGIGIYGLHNAVSGVGPGIFGETNSKVENAAGIVGQVSSVSATFNTAGVKGINKAGGNLGYGIYGLHSGSGWGVCGKSSGGNIGYLGGGEYGVRGGNSNGNIGYIGGSEYAVYGQANGSSSYAGYFDGRGYFSNELRAVGIFSDGADFIAGNGAGLLVSGGGKIDLMDKNGNGPIITLDPKGKTSGMITTPILNITGGSDLAEPFNIADARAIKPGMVVAIDSENPGQLRIADKAYDRTVAGIISGANGINPGMTMSQKGTLVDGALLVALTGRVYAWADVSNGHIAPGDLLTTSDTPGHAMKVTDYDNAQGAIIGKAMTSLENNTGLVLVLVSLQ
jgi:hypothetical protein